MLKLLPDKDGIFLVKIRETEVPLKLDGFSAQNLYFGPKEGLVIQCVSDLAWWRKRQKVCKKNFMDFCPKTPFGPPKRTCVFELLGRDRDRSFEEEKGLIDFQTKTVFWPQKRYMFQENVLRHHNEKSQLLDPIIDVKR